MFNFGKKKEAPRNHYAMGDPTNRKELASHRKTLGSIIDKRGDAYIKNMSSATPDPHIGRAYSGPEHVKSAIELANDPKYGLFLDRDEQGNVLGALAYDNRSYDGRPGYDITRLGSVNPGTGAGRRLMQQFAQHAYDNGKMISVTSPEPDSEEFYRKMGFKPSSDDSPMTEVGGWMDPSSYLYPNGIPGQTKPEEQAAEPMDKQLQDVSSKHPIEAIFNNVPIKQVPTEYIFSKYEQLLDLQNEVLQNRQSIPDYNSYLAQISAILDDLDAEQDRRGLSAELSDEDDAFISTVYNDDEKYIPDTYNESVIPEAYGADNDDIFNHIGSYTQNRDAYTQAQQLAQQNAKPQKPQKPGYNFKYASDDMLSQLDMLQDQQLHSKHGAYQSIGSSKLPDGHPDKSFADKDMQAGMSQLQQVNQEYDARFPNPQPITVGVDISLQDGTAYMQTTVGANMVATTVTEDEAEGNSKQFYSADINGIIKSFGTAPRVFVYNWTVNETQEPTSIRGMQAIIPVATQIADDFKTLSRNFPPNSVIVFDPKANITMIDIMKKFGFGDNDGDGKMRMYFDGSDTLPIQPQGLALESTSFSEALEGDMDGDGDIDETDEFYKELNSFWAYDEIDLLGNDVDVVIHLAMYFLNAVEPQEQTGG